MPHLADRLEELEGGVTQAEMRARQDREVRAVTAAVRTLQLLVDLLGDPTTSSMVLLVYTIGRTNITVYLYTKKGVIYFIVWVQPGIGRGARHYFDKFKVECPTVWSTQRQIRPFLHMY